MKAFDRGIGARQASSLFYSFRNDIIIYTEDKSENKKFYTSLFQKLLDGTGIRVNDLHQLGDCDTVKKLCEEDKDNNHPKLYIIDGDIYLMTTPQNPIAHLYVLDAYCMENKVIDENAYYEVFDNVDSVHDKTEIKKLANYDKMMQEAEAPFLKLYCHFAVSKEICGKHKGISAQAVMTNGSVSTKKIDAQCKRIKDKIITLTHMDEEEFQKRVDAKMKQFPPCRVNLMKYVSGKDCLLVYIDEYTRERLHALQGGQKREFWKSQFLKFCDMSSLTGLKNAIIKEVKDFNEKQKTTA